MTNAPARHLRTGDWIAASAGAFLVVLAARLWLIGRYGSPVPFGDEWDADAANLFLPFLDGRLTWQALLAAHNEHRILLTRLIALAILKAGGRWDVIAQMEVNAAIDAATLVAIALAMAKAASDRGDPRVVLPILGFTTLVGVIPFGWENALWGFQSQFYLFIGVSFGCMVLLVPAQAFSGRWWAGTAMGVTALFTIASGALSFCPPLAVMVLQIVRKQRRGRREIAGIAVLAVLTVLLTLAVPAIPRHGVYKAHTVGAFLSAVLRIASWPLPDGLFVVTQAISVLACGAVIASAPARSDPRWRVVGGVAWLAVQASVLAYGRAAAPMASRYMDVYLVGQIVGAAAAAMLLQAALFSGTWRGLMRLAATAWLVVLLGSDAMTAARKLPPPIRERWSQSVTQASHVRDYLATGDPAALADPGWLHLPYPDTGRLRWLLDAPAIRAILPQALGGTAPETWLAHADAGLVAAAPALLAAGLLLTGIAWVRTVLSGIGLGHFRRRGAALNAHRTVQD